MRTPGAVPNLCKADSGLSAMIGILVAISSHLVARYEDTFLYLLLSNSAPIVRAQDKGARILAALRASHPPLVVVLPVARGRVVRARGPWGWRPLWQRPFFHS